MFLILTPYSYNINHHQRQWTITITIPTIMNQMKIYTNNYLITSNNTRWERPWTPVEGRSSSSWQGARWCEQTKIVFFKGVKRHKETKLLFKRKKECISTIKDGVKTKVVSLKGVRWCDKEGKVPFLSKKECISTIKDEKVKIKRHVAQRMT